MRGTQGSLFIWPPLTYGKKSHADKGCPEHPSMSTAEVYAHRGKRGYSLPC